MAVYVIGVSTTRHPAAQEFGFSKFSCLRTELRFTSGRRVVVLAATGFGKRPQTKPKPRIPKEFDLKTAERTEAYKILFRGAAEEDAEESMKWEELGDILVEPGANVEVAIKERRNALAEAVNQQLPYLSQGKPVQFGYQAAPDAEETLPADEEQNDAEAEDEKSPPSDEEANIVTLDLSGKPTDETVPAILRLKKVEEYYKSMERPRPLRAPAFLPLTRSQRSH